jgi:seryl-tRNA synthetase
MFAVARRGRSHLLLNTSRRDERKRKEEQLKAKAKKDKEYMEDMACEIAALKTELEKKEKDDEENDKNRTILSELYKKGVIDEDGNMV